MDAAYRANQDIKYEAQMVLLREIRDLLKTLIAAAALTPEKD